MHVPRSLHAHRQSQVLYRRSRTGPEIGATALLETDTTGAQKGKNSLPGPMKLNFKFTNLCGVVYEQGNILFADRGTSLISPVGHRITQFDLAASTSVTFAWEHQNKVACVALSPNGVLVVSVDTQGKAIVASRLRRIVLHHFSFGEPVQRLSFSPDGRWLAAVMGRRVEVWRAPSSERLEFMPMELVRTIAGHREQTVGVEWSPCGRFLVTCSLDMSARILVLEGKERTPITLAAHRHPLVAAFFADERVFTVGRDGSVVSWGFDCTEGVLRGEETRSSFGMDAWVTAIAHVGGLVLAGFANGSFGLYKDGEQLHALSIGQGAIDTVAINETGEWLALGTQHQLVVWEWRSESYILRQQGHGGMLACVAWAPDGQTLATGGSDGRVKVWGAQSGFCTGSFTEHTGAVTSVAFTKHGQVLLSASSDGTVRAFDLVRMRSFRTFAAPTPVQFSALAVDGSGEIVVAGTLDTFAVYVWSMQTGQLLEVLESHTGPISALSVDPGGHRLASGSWDGSVRLWDIFERAHNMQVLDHGSEVLALAFRHDGREIVAATLSGQLTFWDPELASVTGTIECRRDVADKVLSAAVFSSVSYAPDGSSVIAAGTFPFAAVYSVTGRLLLRKFPFSTVAMTKDKQLLMDDSEQIAHVQQGAKAVAFSPTGRAWACLTEEGLLVYTVCDTLLFDPFDLEMDITPDKIRAVMVGERDYLRGMVMALRLNVPAVLEGAWRAVPVAAIEVVVRGMPSKYLGKLLVLLAGQLEDGRHRCIEQTLLWLQCTFVRHVLVIRETGSVEYAPTLRRVLKALGQMERDVLGVVEKNASLLDFILESPEDSVEAAVG